MDWGRLKTIFIIAFLVLNVYLLTQMINKQKTNRLEVKTDASLEENLKNDGIDYGDLPKDPIKEQYLSANTKTFTEEETKQLKDQIVSIIDDTTIHAELLAPIELGEKINISELESFIKSNVLYGSKYGYGTYDKESSTVTYFQKHKDKLFLMNRSAHLVFYINKDNEVDRYEQTMLEEVEPISDPEEVLSAIRAVEALYRKGMLQADSKIVRAEIGYYTIVNMEASQVLTPTWHFIVEKDDEFEQMLVNAFEGQVIQLNANSEKNLME